MFVKRGYVVFIINKNGPFLNPEQGGFGLEKD